MPTRDRIQPCIVLVVTILLTATILTIAACTPNPGPEGLTPLPTLAPAETATLVPAIQAAAETDEQPAAGAGSAARGAPFYLLHCTRCHGVQGEGVDAPPLRNNQFIQAGNDQNVFDTIADGRPGTEMPAWLRIQGGPLTDAETGDVVAYLHTLQGVAAVPPATPMPPEPTEAPPSPNAPTPAPARPSLPGGPGPAASLSGDVAKGEVDFGDFCAVCHGPEGREGVGVPNPGSDDGIVPELNPIDPTIANPDPNVFATNVDLFLEHGSVPEGPAPRLMMPSFGDSQMLTQQQIADLIAYVMHLNGVEE
jgi:mono/diheme cytochrome c family protein